MYRRTANNMAMELSESAGPPSPSREMQSGDVQSSTLQLYDDNEPLYDRLMNFNPADKVVLRHPRPPKSPHSHHKYEDNLGYTRVRRAPKATRESIVQFADDLMERNLGGHGWDPEPADHTIDVYSTHVRTQLSLSTAVPGNKPHKGASLSLSHKRAGSVDQDNIPMDMGSPKSDVPHTPGQVHEMAKRFSFVSPLTTPTHSKGTSKIPVAASHNPSAGTPMKATASTAEMSKSFVPTRAVSSPFVIPRGDEQPSEEGVPIISGQRSVKMRPASWDASLIFNGEKDSVPETSKDDSMSDTAFDPTQSFTRNSNVRTPFRKKLPSHELSPEPTTTLLTPPHSPEAKPLDSDVPSDDQVQQMSKGPGKGNGQRISVRERTKRWEARGGGLPSYFATLPKSFRHIASSVEFLKSSPETDEESTVHFEEALENGYVECTMTTCAVTGAAGSGKSHTMYLALNESPPDDRESTGLLEPVRALSTVVGSSQSGCLEWSRVDEDKVLGIVAGATSVTNAEEQPSVQTSPSPLTYSASEESFSTSVPLATPQDVQSQKQPERFSEADISEQVSRSELASYTDVIDEQLTKLAGLLKKPVGRRQVTKLDFLYFLDSGGQPQFHELLSTFIPNLSTILFVLKLSEKLSHHPVIEYYKEGKSVCSYRSPHSHEQILKHCIRALQPEKRSVESNSSSTPNIAVVGTHKDLESQCEGETRDEKNQKLLDLLQPRFGDSLIFYHHLKELIYPVNAKNPDEGDKAVAGKLVEAAIRSSAPKPVRIPLPWFMLEQVLRKLAKERGTGVMRIDECREIASRLHIKPSAFYAALKYLVSLNLFLYYPTILPGVVFCVPQVFLDKINELVQHRHILCGRSSTLPGSAESTSPTGLSGKHWLQFQNHGVFHEKFLQEKAFSTHYDKDLFTPADFLKLLESLLIVGRINTADIEYVMPSLLFELKSEKLDEHRCDPDTSPAAPLLVYFPGEWPTSGVFCSFLASLLSTQNWEVMVDARKTPRCLYRNCFKFRHPLMAGSITLIDSFDQGYFEVHVKAPPEECIKHCPEIRKSVFTALPPKAPVQAEVAFFCPNSKKKDARCRSTLHLADTKSRDYWSCSENPEEVGSLAETLNMTVWGVTRTSASEEREHGCQNPTVGAQLSGSVDEKLSNRPVVYQLKKLKGKEGRTVKVIEGVAAEWEQLAYILQFSPAVVRTVQRDTTDCTAACVEVLYRWINGAEGTRQPVNWATLIECLRDCDFVVLAKDLENVLCEH